jgi:hypothetical protein
MFIATHGIVKSLTTTPSFISGATMITYWDIQNSSSYSGSGTTITDLDGTNNGTLVGSVPYTSGTPKYLSLDSTTSNYVRTSTNLNSSLSPANTGTNISVFTWVYPTSNGVIVSEQGTTSPDTSWYDSQIEWVSGTPRFSVWQYTIGGPPLITSSVSAGLNAWHYVGFTYNGTTLTAYVNGQSAGNSNISRQTPYNTGGGVGLYYTLGYPTSTNMGSGAGANYRLGAFHVWNDAISSSTILNNYNATRGKYGK